MDEASTTDKRFNAAGVPGGRHLAAKLAALRGLSADEAARRLARNFTVLLGSNAAVSLFGLATLALLARALGPAGLGALAMIEAYANTVERCVRLEPWQATIKYGAGTLAQGRQPAFQRLVKFSTLVDLGGAALAAALAVAGLLLLGAWWGIADDVAAAAVLYCLAIAFHLVATPTAVLRLFDRFGLFAKVQTAVAAARLAAVAAVYASGGGLTAFVLTLAACQILESLAMLAFAWRELARRGFGSAWREPLEGVLDENPGILGFVWSSNVSLMLRQSTQRLDTLAVGALLGPAPAGVYHAAKKFGNAIMRLARPVQQAVYPDLARLWSEGRTERFARTALAVNLVTGGAGLCAWLLLAWQAERAVSLALGAAFLEATPLILVQTLAVVLFMFGTSLRPALWSLGLHGADAKITAVATAAFFAWLAVSLPLFGAMGAATGHLAFNAVWLLAGWWMARRAIVATSPRPAPRPEPDPAHGASP